MNMPFGEGDPTSTIAALPDKERQDWGKIRAMSVDLAHSVIASGLEFDDILCLPRGSYEPVNIVSRELGFQAPDLIHACITSYSPGTNQQATHFVVGQMPTPQMVKGKDILIIEEVCDTGRTLTVVQGLLKLAGVASVRTGVLHYKPNMSVTGFKPDWYMEETDKWIVYPWEDYEENGLKLKPSVRKERDIGELALGKKELWPIEIVSNFLKAS